MAQPPAAAYNRKPDITQPNNLLGNLTAEKLKREEKGQITATKVSGMTR
jgi:hypothetical protein